MNAEVVIKVFQHLCIVFLGSGDKAYQTGYQGFSNGFLT